MRYKVGDRVRIKSLDWYNENKNKTGFICFDYTNFIPEMSRYCGEILTINRVVEEFEHYLVSECAFSWTDEMIEGLVEEENTLSKNAKLVSERFSEYVNPSEFKYAQDTITKMLLQGANIPNEYILKDENGNVINATKIVLEKKKKKYPKTYEECCDGLGLKVCPKVKVSIGDALTYRGLIAETFIKLLACRDAYLKRYEIEMKLNSRWTPDYEDLNTTKFCITTSRDKVIKVESSLQNYVLAFPTEEMRDAFYENFKKEIEICKKFL